MRAMLDRFGSKFGAICRKKQEREQLIVRLSQLERESSVAYCLANFLPERQAMPPQEAVLELSSQGECVSVPLSFECQHHVHRQDEGL